MDEVEARFYVNLEIQKATNRKIDYSKLMSTERLLARMIVDDAIHNYFDTFEISYDRSPVEDVKEAGFLVDKLRQARKILLED
jgi:hypothetical protein